MEVVISEKEYKHLVRAKEQLHKIKMSEKMEALLSNMQKRAVYD